MSCDNVQERVSTFLDRELPVAERENVLAHIDSCRDCSKYLKDQQEVRTMLRGLKPIPVPADLTARLRVAASHDRQRRLAQATLGSRWHSIRDRLQLALDNMMRPLALPFAGGVVSSIMMFGMLVPSLTFHHAFADQVLFTHPDGEVVMMTPNGMYSSAPESENAPRIQRPDLAPPETANVVDLDVDVRGRVSSWSLVQGELTPDLVTIILIGHFNPATNMGVPIPSKVRAFQLRNVQTPPIRVRS